MIAEKILKYTIILALMFITWHQSSLYYNNKIDKIETDFKNYREATVLNIEKQKNSILEQNNKLKEENIQLISKLKELENESYTKYQELQKTNASLRTSIASNQRRLSVRATCTESTSSSNTKTENNTTTGLDDGKTSRAIIDSRDAESIIRITEKADKYKSQLDALQNYINTLILENNK